MKLTSRALKVGDTIIRKEPLSIYNSSFTTTPVTIKKKGLYHTEVEFDTDNTKEILPHHKWNDDNWVRWK